MSNSSTQAVAATAVKFTDVTLTFREHFKLAPDSDPWAVGNVRLERSPGRCRLHQLHEVHTSPSDASLKFANPEDRGETYRPTKTAEVWSNFLSATTYSDVSVFVGPGETPIIFEPLTLDASRFQVFDATSGRPELVGKYLHPMQAKQAAKRILNSGGCPVVVAFHDISEFDASWDSQNLLSVTECDCNERQSMNHLLSAAKRGSQLERTVADEQANAIVKAIVTNSACLDSIAIAGLTELIEFAQASPEVAAETVQEVIQ